MTRRIWTGITASFAMLLLILDAKTAVSGALEGIGLCLQTVIPSLLPFFVLSILLTSAIAGSRVTLLRPLGKFCGMPEGAESIFLIGLLGGYPTGAQSVAQAYRTGQLSKYDARRMLGFCSNAGPAFLFGMVAARFDDPNAAWLLWGIHILSAVIVGMLLPGRSQNHTAVSRGKEITLSDAVRQSAKIMASVCVWVIMFRVIIAFMDRWVLWLFSDTVRVIVCGILELSNGCCNLGRIPNEELRFVLCSGMLALGGLCVVLQTSSVTGELGFGCYLPGKLLQALISLILAAVTQQILYGNRVLSVGAVAAMGLAAALSTFILWKRQNNGSIPAEIGV